MKKYLLSLLVLCLFSMSVSAIELHYPISKDVQVEAIAFQVPSPVIANDKAYLVYEFYLTNFGDTPIKLIGLNITGDYGSTPASKVSFKFSDTQLASMMHSFGQIDPKVDPQIIAPGMRKMVFVLLNFAAPYQIPNTLKHYLTVQPLQAGAKPIVMEEMPFNVKQEPAVIVGAPLQGGPWYLSGGVANDSNHRAAYRISSGQVYYAQRYALDLIKIGANGKSYEGDVHKKESYFCYKQNVYAVANGQVVAIKDGIPENIPASGKLAVPITIDTVGGNYVIINIGYRRYAFYAHLVPGSLKVKVGDIVKKGQVIGLLGNSGNSTEPHLHFHIVDGPSFLGANAVPYGFEKFVVIPNKVIAENNTHRLQLSNVSTEQTNQLLWDGVTFKFPENIVIADKK